MNAKATSVVSTKGGVGKSTTAANPVHFAPMLA